MKHDLKRKSKRPECARKRESTDNIKCESLLSSLSKLEPVLGGHPWDPALFC